MKKTLILLIVICLSGCKNELTFKTVQYDRKAAVLNKFDSPKISVKVPLAENNSEMADSINRKVFSVVKSIILIDSLSININDYDALLADFVGQYQKLITQNPTEPFGWDAKVDAKVKHLSETLLNIEINFYSYTGGAHGYQGLRSVFLDPSTGKSIPNAKLFKNEIVFKNFAEKLFRQKFNIPFKSNINSTGLMFENDTFQLPENYLYTNSGLVLHYNSYEIASYAQGPQELFITATELAPFIAIK